jgi:hypothetical protein
MARYIIGNIPSPIVEVNPYAAMDARLTEFVVDPARTASGTGSEASPLNPTQAYNDHNPNGGPGPVYEWLPGSLNFSDADPNSKYSRWHPRYSGSVAFPILHRTRFKASRAGVTQDQMTHIRRTSGAGGILGVLNTTDCIHDGFSIPNWHGSLGGAENFQYSVWGGQRARLYRAYIDGQNQGVISNPDNSTNCGAIYHQATVDCEVADTYVKRIGASTGLRVHAGAESYSAVRLSIHHCEFDGADMGIFHKGETTDDPANTGCRYSDNVVHNIRRRGLFQYVQHTGLTLANAAWWYRNYVYDCAEQGFWVNPPVTFQTSGVVVVNNFFAFCGFSAFTWRWAGDFTPPFTPIHIVRNNIFLANTRNIEIEGNTWASTVATAANVDRNLYHQYTSHYSDSGGNRAFSGANQWQSLSGYLGQANDANGLNTDPLVVSAALRNFRLQAGSPARDAGRDYQGILTGVPDAVINLGPDLSSDMTGYFGPRPHL